MKKGWKGSWNWKWRVPSFKNIILAIALGLGAVTNPEDMPLTYIPIARIYTKNVDIQCPVVACGIVGQQDNGIAA